MAMQAGGLSLSITTNLFSQVVAKCHNHKYAVIRAVYTHYTKTSTTMHIYTHNIK